MVRGVVVEIAVHLRGLAHHGLADAEGLVVLRDVGIHGWKERRSRGVPRERAMLKSGPFTSGRGSEAGPGGG